MKKTIMSVIFMKNNKVLFLYGKLRNKNKAMYYCKLHGCYIDKQNLFAKNFKCKNCKHSTEVIQEETWDN